MQKMVDVAAVGDVAEGAVTPVDVAGKELLLARVGGEFYAADARCPHMGGRLSQGTLDGTVIVCPRHGSRFDLRDGHVVRWTDFSGIGLSLAKVLRSPRPLRTHPVRVQGDRLVVELDDGA